MLDNLSYIFELAPGDLFIVDTFGCGFIRGGLIKLLDTCRTKSSFSKLLFSVVFKEQSKFKHQCMSRSSPSSLVGSCSRDAYYQFEILAFVRKGGGAIRGFTVYHLWLVFAALSVFPFLLIFVILFSTPCLWFMLIQSQWF